MDIMKITPVCLAFAVLSGCGSGGSDSDGANNDNNTVVEPVVAAANPANPYAETSEASYLLAGTENKSQTAALVVDPQFSFDTTKETMLTLDVEAARGAFTEVSICTDYEQNDNGYNVDFNSCILTASMQDGRLQHPLTTLEQYDSVIAVVWLTTPGTIPEFREIALN